ncbi:hypothetical protein K440DRAFT_637456 [Wilcoxina mikolae CBS 423.85]|nr:hypothetical protein K440DRAFT_637456 [Wilcoxina mikolae CBS 423.85]
MAGAIDAKALLMCLGLWRYVTGNQAFVPRPPATASTPRPKNALDPEYVFKPEFSDSAYMFRFNHFITWWEDYQNKRCLAYEYIHSGLEPSRYRELDHGNPKKLWDTIKADFEKVISQYELQTKLVDENFRKFLIISNLQSTDEWTTFAWTLELNGKTDTSENIITHLLSFEARLRRARGLAPGAALFVSKKARGRNPKKVENRPIRVHQASSLAFIITSSFPSLLVVPSGVPRRPAT